MVYQSLNNINFRKPILFKKHFDTINNNALSKSVDKKSFSLYIYIYIMFSLLRIVLIKKKYFTIYILFT